MPQILLVHISFLLQTSLFQGTILEIMHGSNPSLTNVETQADATE